jgi:uncharacterized membrane protein
MHALVLLAIFERVIESLLLGTGQRRGHGVGAAIPFAIAAAAFQLVVAVARPLFNIVSPVLVASVLDQGEQKKRNVGQRSLLTKACLIICQQVSIPAFAL